MVLVAWYFQGLLVWRLNIDELGNLRKVDNCQIANRCVVIKFQHRCQGELSFSARYRIRSGTLCRNNTRPLISKIRGTAQLVSLSWDITPSQPFSQQCLHRTRHLEILRYLQRHHLINMSLRRATGSQNSLKTQGVAFLSEADQGTSRTYLAHDGLSFQLKISGRKIARIWKASLDNCCV